MFAHNLIHIFCAELPPRWKTALDARFPARDGAPSALCLFFKRFNKNDINQCTWRLTLRLHTILSTDCVQNLWRRCGLVLAGAATFLIIEKLSFKINGLTFIHGFSHNLVHSNCAEL
ncbi:hypothetical protein [Janthinobacterium psychrotolerans]|uniref:hypothetical protein n=1 Tax=Janthinobacterium psychrotolerans TaxID=1747903 RepID=UPI0014960A7A|nr:hypothetical protein [Janthinobacterium psychrotolerans]